MDNWTQKTRIVVVGDDVEACEKIVEFCSKPRRESDIAEHLGVDRVEVARLMALLYRHEVATPWPTYDSEADRN